MADAELSISSKTYSSWSLRGWLLCRMAGLEVREKTIALDDPENRAELLLLSPSVLVPRLTHEGASVWDTLAIAEYLNELYPDAGLYPEDRIGRAHCRSVSGEIHSGFANLRSAMPMNLKVRHERFPLFSPGRMSSGSRRSGTNVWTPMAALGCSGKSRPWPMRCSRRSRNGS
jgi:glutathione S-transferase